MFSLAEVCDEISRQIREVSGQLSMCEWSIYAEVLDENCPAIQEELTRMREKFWSPSTVNSEQQNQSNKELYDPIQKCWESLDYCIFQETFFPIIKGLSIDEIFSSHLICASLVYQWGKSIASDNEHIASEAFKLASSLFDKCIGMVWFKAYVDKKNKLSKVRVKAGKKGGDSKAEVYKIIQEKFVELIYQYAPEEGWKSKLAAVNELIDPLWSFVEDSDFLVKEQSKKYRLAYSDKIILIDAILNRWATKVESIRLAFDTTVRKKRKGN